MRQHGLPACLHRPRFVSSQVGPGTWPTAPQRTVPSSSAGGWGLFLDLGAPLANLTGTLPRLGTLRAPDGLLT